MGKIKLLPERVINQIAAGEVVQRPASVIKELVENSIDAQATQIEIFLEKAGKKLIHVKDNGIGMLPEDARMCFERHATSKITDIEDLYKLYSLGFRGEALASIASVSQVELKTKPKETELGTFVKVEGGNVIAYEQIQTFPGTSLKVEHLFYNIPARRNFLRSDTTEFKHILNIYIPLTLSHPKIAFHLTHNGKQIYKLPSGNLKQRILTLFPRLKEEQLREINFKYKNISLQGFAGAPEAAQSQRTYYFFANQRYIKSPYLHKIITEAYGNMLEKDKHPFYVLFLELSPESIDVNIHPTKTEVRFENLQEVGSIVKQAVLQAFGLRFSQENFSFPEKSSLHSSFPKASVSQRKFHFPEENKKTTPESWEQFIRRQLKPETSSETSPPSLYSENPGNEEIFVSSQGLIFSLGSKLKVYYVARIYQRLTFDKLRKGFSKIPSQQLLYPVKILITQGESEILKKYKTALKNYGFTWEEEEFQLIISGIPAILQAQNIEEIFRNLLELLSEPYNSEEQIRNEIFKYFSLHTRTEFPTNEFQAKELLKEYEKSGAPLFAPDGKPIVKEFEI